MSRAVLPFGVWPVMMPLLMAFTRSSGVLLHPTSFPGNYGIGSLSRLASSQWLDWLARAGQHLWQIMPLGHTGYGDSPYQSFSAFAGNPLLIALEDLVSAGWLPAEALADAPAFPADLVDYGWVYVWKWPVLRQAFAGFHAKASAADQAAYAAFQQNHHSWLPDYALFMALKAKHGGGAWNTWESKYKKRNPAALNAARKQLKDDIELYTWVQYVFFEQWLSIKADANRRGIQIIGDIPIFVALDSSDVWANQKLFYLDPEGQPLVVAGVPPDYFSATGQLWGNPLYRWDVMQKDNFSWWMSRFQATFELVDIVRVDHFRGFEAFWEVPGTEETAINGRWVKAPGVALFQAVNAKFGELPIIAEDLGLITPEVELLRDQFNLPGMKVLHFAFDAGPDHPYLPHTYGENAVVYPGTHDNDTSKGWYLAAKPELQDTVRRYLKVPGHDIAWDLLKAAWHSKANMAIVSLQDIMGLGSEARMNIPGVLGGRNWGWRYSEAQLTAALSDGLRYVTEAAGRS
jgi:4-alpha-glucanotransferase